MTWVETAYTLGLAAVRPALAVAARGSGKLARGVRGRRGTVGRMAAWSAQRDRDRPLVWFHAPSVGEGLQARAVMEIYRERNPDAQVAFTFFSPSAEPLAASMPADIADYLPWDLPRDVASALDLLTPDVIAFSKTDVWPNLTRAAAARSVMLALLSGTLPASSSRLRGPARALLGPAYRRIDRVAAISATDARRFELLGVSADRVSVMGDAHFDRVLSRADRVDPDSDLLRPLAGRPGDITLVAGSTWPPDEERLLPLIAAARAAPHGGRHRLVLVPHEPTPAHLETTERRLHELGLTHRRLSRLDGRWDGDEVLLVDRVGVLGALYAIADIAYVGGGWGRAGLHSILEPAAFGMPVIFGPRHSNAGEAAEMIEGGGAFSASSPDDLHARLRLLFRSEAARTAAGEAARRYVEAGRGAAERGARLIEELVTEARATR